MNIRSGYIYKDDFLHRLDARAKIFFTLSSLLFLIAESSSSSIFAFLSLIVILTFHSLGMMGINRAFAPVSFLLLFIFILSPFSCREGTPLLMLSDFVLVTKEGLSYSLHLALRLTGISFLFSLLFSTERMENLLSALTSFGLKYPISLSVILSLSFVHRLSLRYSEIKDAISLRKGGSVGRKGILDVLSALIVYALKEVSSTSNALVGKGYDGKGKVTDMHPLSSSYSVVIISIICILLPWIFHLL